VVDHELVGGGGCVAHALTALGVFPTLATALLRLNAEIDPVHAIFTKHNSAAAREQAGVDDDRWSAECIKRAVVAAGCHWHKLRLPESGLLRSLAPTLARGSYLIDGVLNCEYQDVDGEMVETDPADVGPRPWEDNARWRHAVALIDGVVHEQHEQRLPMAVLHLESPFKEGYFLSVLKIYRVVRCRAGDSASCRGECVGPLA
jgi:hypothetical protein